MIEARRLKEASYLTPLSFELLYPQDQVKPIRGWRAQLEVQLNSERE